MKMRFTAPLVSLFLAASVGLHAQTFIWTGASGSTYFDSYYFVANWQDEIAPTVFTANNGNDTIIFGNVRNTHVRYVQLKADQLQFTGHTRPYELEALGEDTLYLGAGGILYSPNGSVRSIIDDSVVLTASQTWNIAGGALAIERAIHEEGGSKTLTKTGAGALVLNLGHYDASDWSGGFHILDGRVSVKPRQDYYGPAPITALGTGTVTFNSSGGGTPTLVARRLYVYGNYDTPLIVPNAIAINGTMTTENQTEVILSGNVTLLSNATLASRGMMLSIQGGISGTGHALTIDSTGLVVLVPGETESTNTYSGGTHVAKGLLVFGDENAIPASGNISVSNFGYAGLAAPSYGVAKFIAKFNPTSTHGTIGFDSDPSNSANVFEGPINLTGFSGTARLGSATRAIINSASSLTPQGLDYRFGGGGGQLTVGAPLGNAPDETPRNVVGASPSSLPLTVYLNNSGNDFSGTVSAAHTAFIFANGALPAAASLQLQQGGYIGLEDSSNPQAFIDRFPNTTSQGMIGLNGSSDTTTITADLDLSAITGNVYLGTTQRGYTDDGISGGVRLTGTITPANFGNYRFAGYKGGLLRVESSLSGSNEVHIGDPTAPATYGDFNEKEISTVALMGNNSGLTGNVVLFGGQLYLGNVNALGAGSLVVQGMTLPAEWTGEQGEPLAPQLAIGFGDSFSNNIILNTRLDIAEYSSATLAGQISGPGQLYLREYSALTLSSNNTFNGGVYVSADSNLYLAANQASGTGPLSFGSSDGEGSYVYFETTNPVIGGLISGEGDYAYLYSTLSDTILTINQSFDSKFRGEFRSNAIWPDDNLRLVKNGTGTLNFNEGGMYFHRGTTEATLPGTPEVSLQINQGTVILGDSFYLESNAPTIWVHGGTLALENSYLSNPLVVDNGGRLAGQGSFASAAIGTGAVLSPGLPGADQIGSLGFAHLELNSGGLLEWHIQSPTGSAGEGYDHIDVFSETTLVINATSESPFSIKVISLNTGGNAGLLGDLLPGQSFAWTIFSFDALSGGFDPAKFALDVSLFQTNLGNGLAAGDFSFALSGNDLVLNFTAVPEPSTYALMLLGLGFIGWTVWRRRRV